MAVSVELLKLIPTELTYKGKVYVPLRDIHRRDTETIATGDISKDFFRTTKKPSQTLFEGEKQLVKDPNIFLILSLSAWIRDRILTRAEWQQFFGKGYFEMKISVPEEVIADKDVLDAISFGAHLMDRITTETAVNEALNPARWLMQKRVYLIGQSKVVPYGRVFDFSTYWPETGGNGLTASADLVINIFGVEYEPKKV